MHSSLNDRNLTVLVKRCREWIKLDPAVLKWVVARLSLWYEGYDDLLDLS
jgi:hypothetical protein